MVFLPLTQALGPFAFVTVLLGGLCVSDKFAAIWPPAWERKRRRRTQGARLFGRVRPREVRQAPAPQYRTSAPAGRSYESGRSKPRPWSRAQAEAAHGKPKGA